MAQPEALSTASEPALQPVGGGKLIDEVRDIVLHRMTRVIDTFHQWDADSSNTISHAEFTRAMHTLGIRVSADVDTIWQQFDRDGSGEIAYHELLSVLNPNLAPDNPSLRALDPNNNRQEFHYTKNDAADAYKLIERSTGADEPYAHRVATDPGAVDRKFRQGYLRSGVHPNAKHVPKEHKVGRVPGLSLGASADADTIVSELREALINMATTRVIDVFRAWDVDQSGAISRREFAKAMAALGLQAAKEDMNRLFDQFDLDRNETIEYHELEKALGLSAARRTRLHSAPKPSVPTGMTPSDLKKQAAKKGERRKVQRAQAGGAGGRGRGGRGGGAATKQTTPLDQIREMLLQRMGRAVDVFRQLDTDHSNTISLTEFERAMSTLGLPASTDIHALWKELDTDGSGEIVYHELLAVLNPSVTADGASEIALDPSSKSRFHYNKRDAEDAARLIDRTEYRTTPYALEVHANQAARAYNAGGHARDSRITKFVPKEYAVGRLPGFDLDPSSGAAAVKEQLRAAMTDVANVRVIDVFRAWDTDESGTISRREFAKAMATLGLAATTEEMEDIFATFDPDGSGTIEYAELKSALVPHRTQGHIQA